MSTFKLVISTPDGNMFSDNVIGFSVRGSEGDLAILAGHIPFITSVKPCECVIRLTDSTEKRGTTEGGLLTVTDKETTFMSGTFIFSSSAMVGLAGN